MDLLYAAHDADAILAEAPICYNCLTLPSVSRSISEYRTEVFTKCVSNFTCRDRTDYLERAREIARWTAET